ncbi:fungal specific transcription factor domain-containing protein [Aspergillus lucknowensis]|uniref:Fungal-specific transcription factor domain-containing protein n=1 Tax=Aspergillus lucknowensis TaxID=176173 RepID=A0ABR4LKZ5_9EURO
MAVEASLPPRHAADYLVDVYFQYQTPHLPIVGRSDAEEAIESAYEAMDGREVPGRAVERDILVSFMILAIALCDVSNPSGGRPSQSEGCFRSAIGWYEKAITSSKSDIETLRTILLLAQFIALCPSRGSLWHLTGIALRLCIDMGLHWETDDRAVNMSSATLYDRRRLWYSTYQFDRMLCITLGRPFGIIDESIRVPLPNPWAIHRGTPSSEFDIHSQRAHNHLFLLSKLASEIKHVQHSQVWALKIAYPRADYNLWVQDIQPRLEEWYATIPPMNKAHQASIFASQAYWDYVYNNTLLLLYRPNISTTGSHMTSPDATVLAFAASCQLIASIKTLQREGGVDILWQTAHHLFMAGLGVIYSLWQSKEVRDQNPRGSSVSTLQSCASTLSALAESFPGVAGCRDAFDTLSSATVNWLVNDNAGEPQHDGHHREFRKQAEDLLQQLRPVRGVREEGGMKMSDMMVADGFLFSEMLSSAAQWPDSQDSALGDMGFDTLGGGFSVVN